MGGRPINEDRALSIFLGEKTYQGSPHKKCGTTERYINGGCVYCARIIATEQREARKYLQRHAAQIDGRGDQGGGYPSSQGPLDNDEPMVLEESDDAEARSQQAIDDLM